MPWGWECRSKLIKQIPAKPTQRRGPVSGENQGPAPNKYEPPEVFCGKGYSKIKRSPAYTFGHRIPSNFQKSVTTPYAPMFNVQGLGKKGQYKITHSVVTPHIEPVQNKQKIPGPGAYAPRTQIRYKRPAAYSMRPAAKPKYEPWDQWTPSPNMYWPPILGKKPPAYTLGSLPRDLKGQDLPGPGEHEPNFGYIRKRKPVYSFGAPFQSTKPTSSPAPNAYCEKKFMYTKRTIPAPSFGIRHSPYIGQ